MLKYVPAVICKMCIFKINGAKKPKQTTLHSKPIQNKISRTVTFAIQNYTLPLKKMQFSEVMDLASILKQKINLL